ncbi:transcriptional regulatory domain protein [Mycobacterium ulcerans str. Harvey]|uniref:Transcriptional regulatory domain protein n=1 Tax=Mycobacterium ulcerans str. Harvey TaxID=1299332 RepID=A0ABP3A4V1_MYCUL|nr:transcriptional regulatory domain protein [Mycobacterium ulcerans str. Harvey]
MLAIAVLATAARIARYAGIATWAGRTAIAHKPSRIPPTAGSSVCTEPNMKTPIDELAALTSTPAVETSGTDEQAILKRWHGNSRPTTNSNQLDRFQIARAYTRPMRGTKDHQPAHKPANQQRGAWLARADTGTVTPRSSAERVGSV